ncbi:MAG TPA: phage holin family protein [Planctomycetaceae bacterium]|nr:phage holin family protein [Planctomycetaceae bacterium]
MTAPAHDERDFPELLTDTVGDVQKLIEQHVELVRLEAQQGIAQAVEAAALCGSGAGLLAASGLLSSLALVHWLHERGQLPKWASYGIMAGAVGGGGLFLWKRGCRSAARALRGLPQTREALQEDLSWLQSQFPMTPPWPDFARTWPRRGLT